MSEVMNVGVMNVGQSYQRPLNAFFALFTQSCIGCELKSWLLMWASAVPTSEEESQQHITGYQCNLHGGQELG